MGAEQMGLEELLGSWVIVIGGGALIWYLLWVVLPKSKGAMGGIANILKMLIRLIPIAILVIFLLSMCGG